MMAEANVTKSVLSVSSPGTNINANDNALNLRLTRFCNSYAAFLKRDHPSKFAFWAALPGFGLLTNYYGTYLGSASFDPVFDDLNRLKAIVFIHPTRPCVVCQATSSKPSMLIDATPLAEKYPLPMFRVFFDTSRAVTDLFLSGTVERCSNIRLIIPHSRGGLPHVISWFTGFASMVSGGPMMSDEKVRGALARQFFFDLAGFVSAGDEGGSGQLKTLIEGYNIDPSRLLYGSDFPFTQTQFVKIFADRIKPGLEDLFSEQEWEAIYEKNATALLAE